MQQSDLEDRIVQTLTLVERRGYNLTYETLAQNLRGGSVSTEMITSVISSLHSVETDGHFVATKGHLFAQKCADREQRFQRLHHKYMAIARDYSSTLLSWCPWILCMMVSGSLASGGIGNHDDIDFNIIVDNKRKFLTFVFGFLLGVQYSLRFGRMFSQSYFHFIPKVICLSLIWEHNQVFPFARQDDQIAYELLIAHVIYNPQWYGAMIKYNQWLNEFFPQIYEKYSLQNTLKIQSNQISRSVVIDLCDSLARRLLFIAYKLVRFSRSHQHQLQSRMDTANRVKQPYSLFDIPSRH